MLFQKINNFIENSKIRLSKKDPLPDYIVTSDNKDMVQKDRYNIKYDIDSLIANVHNNNLYLLSDKNIDIVKEELPLLSNLLCYASSECNEVPFIKISDTDLCFTENLVSGVTAYCFITFENLTSSGNIPKYPYSFHIHISEKEFGTVYYNKENEIGKFHFIIHTYLSIYELTFHINQGAIELTVYKTDCYIYSKNKIYSSKENIKSRYEIDTTELAYELFKATFNSFTFDDVNFTDYKYENQIRQIFYTYPENRDRFLQVVNIGGGKSTPQKRFITAMALFYAGDNQMHTAIYYIKLYIDNPLWDRYLIENHQTKEQHLASMYEILGNAYEVIGDNQNALSAYALSIKYDNSFADIYIYMVNVLLKMNRIDLAFDIIENAKANPNYNNHNLLFSEDFKQKIDDVEKQLNVLHFKPLEYEWFNLVEFDQIKIIIEYK